LRVVTKADFADAYSGMGIRGAVLASAPRTGYEPCVAGLSDFIPIELSR
jgi:hypothetical protein